MTLLRSLLLAVLITGCITQKRQDRANARVELGSAYLREGTTELAIATLMEATELDPRNVDAWDRLGLAYMKRGALDKSEESFEKALALNAESAQVNLNYSYLLINLGRTKKAIAVLEMALKDLTYRQPAKILNNLGYACLLDGQVVRAILHLREAVLRAPNDCNAWYNLGIAQQENALLDESVEAFDRVIMLCPKQSQGSYFKAAEVLLAQNKGDDAVHYMQQSCLNDPGSQIGQLAIQRLAEWGSECPLGPSAP